MTRGRTSRGRARALRGGHALSPARPLVIGEDHGDPVRLDGSAVGATGDRWMEPFLQANRSHLRRLDVSAEIRAERGVHISLQPGARIGAVPLLSPSTRRVAAGLLIKPRFQWSSLGSVFTSIGFSVEPSLGGAPAVPGSAREVPPWILAGPVLNRIEALLSHRRRGFIERSEERDSPRGRVAWATWASRYVSRGRWSKLPCTFPDPDDDPHLMASVRWTLGRIRDELAPLREAAPARALLERAAVLSERAGQGPSIRPVTSLPMPSGSGWLSEAVEAMQWVADERGLGGARSLDGLAWDLAVDAVWEAWVVSFAAELARSTGMVTLPLGAVRHRLRWDGVASMTSLAPDAVLHGGGRTVWIDAKYKAHLALLRRHGWPGLGDSTQGAHRADLHQALAYANLSSDDDVTTVLVYPHLDADEARPPSAIASLGAGRRRVRLVLAALPFGWTGPGQQQRWIGRWRGLIAAA